jgi:threonine dehydratase
MSAIQFTHVLEARRRIEGGVYYTPCPESIPLSEITGCRVFCKLESLQRTGSFKERGARNALMQFDDDQRSRGAIAASAGNHALGLACHGMLLNIPITVVMPQFAPLVKVTTCRHLKANVILHGETFADAVAHARAIAEREQLTYIHGYDDPAIITGQGTVGLEILEQVPDVEAIVVPIGGGGLIAGIALAVKTQRPDVKIIGVEPASMAHYLAALEAGHPVRVESQPTLADGLAVPTIGENAFAVAQPRVDEVVTVDEHHLALAILRLLEREKNVVEGAGAAPLAALLSGKLDDLQGQRVVMVLSGGNIDPAVLGEVIEKGLVADGRLCRFTAQISDRPGGLATLASVIAGCGASVRQITHDRAFSGADVTRVNVLCIVETRDRDHMAKLHDAMRRQGIEFHTHDGEAIRR